MNDAALTTLAGGTIPVDPLSLEPTESYFAVEISLPSELEEQLGPATGFGSVTHVSFRRRYEPLGVWVVRRCLTFVEKMMIG